MTTGALFGQRTWSSAKFSAGKTLRREIRRWWTAEPMRWAVWLMLNPSVASDDRDDPTAKRVTHFSKAHGCDGWIGVNLYPFIASKPVDMWRWADWERNGPDWHARDQLQANRQDIEQAARMATLRVVAFGAAALRDETWIELCLESFGQPANTEGADEQFYCLGETQNGMPLHPLARGKFRVPDDRRLSPWSMPR